MNETLLIIVISVVAGLMTFIMFIYALEMLLNVIRKHKEEMNKILSKVEELMFKYETMENSKRPSLKEKWEKDVSNNINRMTLMLHNDEDD